MHIQPKRLPWHCCRLDTLVFKAWTCYVAKGGRVGRSTYNYRASHAVVLFLFTTNQQIPSTLISLTTREERDHCYNSLCRLSDPYSTCREYQINREILACIPATLLPPQRLLQFGAHLSWKIANSQQTDATTGYH